MCKVCDQIMKRKRSIDEAVEELMRVDRNLEELKIGILSLKEQRNSILDEIRQKRLDGDDGSNKTTHEGSI